MLDGDVPWSLSYGVYTSQLIRSARVCSYVDDFKKRNLSLTAKLLKQGISESIFYGNLVYKCKIIAGKPNSSDQLKILSSVAKVWI